MNDVTGEADELYDVIVLGAGPGGYVAGIRAGQLGLRTAVIERAELGGICLNWGCIPTKALLHGAEVARAVRSGAEVGILAQAPSVEVSALVAHSRRTADTLAGGVGALLKGNGVDILRGTATVADKGRVRLEIDGRTRDLAADHIIVATGAGPRSLPGIEPDGSTIWTYRQALVPDEIPESLVVIGSGAIGSEFASLYADLGSKVTLLESLDRIMPGESPEVSALVTKSFNRRGITTMSSVRVESVDVVGSGDGGATIRTSDAKNGEQTLTASKVLLAVGVAPNSADLGLDRFDILDKAGFVTVDSLGATGVWGLYAIGDVAGGPCLAHKASHEALRCVDAIAGVRREPEPDDWREWVPRCTYTTPEVASVGIDVAAAKARGHNVATARIGFAENGRALGAAETEGFARVVVDADTDEILGASLVGAGVTELIASVVVARTAGVPASVFASSMFPHPTRSEILGEAMSAALGRPINSL